MENLTVIFRKEYDPYMKIWKYLAVFPECCNWKGDMSCLPFYDVTDGVMFENHDECSVEYYHKTKTIRNSELLSELKVKVERYYNSLPGEKTNLIVRLKRRL